MRKSLAGMFALLFTQIFVSSVVLAEDPPRPQYQAGEITVSHATEQEAKAEKFSVALASKYLEQGTEAWQSSRKCVSCHTNGIYMTIRPSLTPEMGPPTNAVRESFVAMLKEKQAADREGLKKGTVPAQVIYLAAGLAEWDAHVTKSLSAETVDAISLMLEIQQDDGTWGSLDCWPPYESDAYHLATVAAMAIGTAPDWLAKHGGEAGVAAKLNRLKSYLAETAPPHDYARVLLLWASLRMPGLIEESRQQEIVSMITSKQKADGGWSIRSFAKPEEWGSGNRAGRLNAEPDLADPASDGHQTGLAIIVLREAGIEATDPRLKKGVDWLLANQRESGRWWTKSLNTDSYHFITYSGTAFPLRALAMCNALPKAE